MGLLRQRRIIASISGFVILFATITGVELEVTAEELVIMFSSLSTALLPLLSYFFPKK